MSPDNTAAVVAEILKDFILGATLPIEQGLNNLERAVRSLRISAFTHTHAISQQQRQQLDAAIRTAQPFLAWNDVEVESGDNQELTLRLMVGSLHIVTAEWSKVERTPLAMAPSMVVEACALARMLENHLNDQNIVNGLRRHRATLDQGQLTALRSVVDALYPLPQATPEPMPFYATGSIN